MQLLLKVALGNLAEELKINCPFLTRPAPPFAHQDESAKNDDRVPAQENDSTKLAHNLISGSPGDSKTWNPDYFEAEGYKCKRVDSKPPSDEKITLISIKIITDRRKISDVVAPFKGEKEIETQPYQLAPHHCIPGEASLADSKLNNYLREGSYKDPDFTVLANAGYNINGSHNGVWLPAWYAITGWGGKPFEWQAKYVAALVVRTGRQFHDTHNKYNDNVLGLLNGIAVQIQNHRLICPVCRKKKETPPAYRIIPRLIGLSTALRRYLTGDPRDWNLNWVASDKWRAILVNNNTRDYFYSEYILHKYGR